MSLYTTGELAKKCNVSVRTIQYYDERGILVPTDLTEGGRRLFSEEDVATLETICFLRDLVAMAVIPSCVAIMFGYWYKRVEYLCPECHTRFQPKKLEAFFGNHTPKTRKLTCPTCRRRIWSLEVYRKEVDA